MPFRLSTMNFNSHTPCGVRPDLKLPSNLLNTYEFQLTHPMWGATQAVNAVIAAASISTHTPHVGCDRRLCRSVAGNLVFQLTHPMWGATQPRTDYLQRSHFNSHTPCGVRQVITLVVFTTVDFNSHTPCGVRRGGCYKIN